MDEELIFQCIQNASDDEVRTVLAGLCTDGVVKNTAVKLFEKLGRLSNRGTTLEERRSGSPAPTQYICIICRNAYTEEGNSPTACRYHPGTLDRFNEDSYHWDEYKRADVVDCQYMKDRNPGGWEWTCCNQYGVEGGSKTVQPRQGSEISHTSGSSREEAGSSRKRKRARAEVIVISDDEIDDE
ncbi:hypothetical protein C8A00DRAFT_34928 [Chaetomidium leptoderma]|uniref:Uncharacterized protein n=1 Tax=Chaetomidium leptoderma TaxID=669021 RepID=A0AAN6VL50_9PEZI|nr:hypothetical protein C8A00DRAFT_34928 [Chaetomidium leptoderma]